MSVFGILETGRSGLAASQTGIQTVGQNITNAATEGYSRRSVVLSPSVPTNLGGRGVQVLALERAEDPVLQRALLQARGDAASSQARASILGPTASSFNELEEDGVGAAIDALWASFQLLEARPSDLAARADVLARVEEVASAFQRQSTALERQVESADARIRSGAERLDELAARIAELNKEIGAAAAKGGGQELKDQRDMMVRQVAELVDTSVIEQPDGTITLVIAGGIPLVDGNQARHIRVDPLSGPNAARIQFGADPSLWIDITDRVGGGELAGLLTARDTDLASYQGQLDQLAFDVASAVNNQHSIGFGLDGVTGRNLFTALGGPAGAASQLSVDATVAGNPEALAAALEVGLAGDNRNASALVDLRYANIAAGGSSTAAEEYTSLMGGAAAAARQAENQSTTRGAAESQAEAFLQQEVGVSVDEEMISMIAYERAYQAAAKLITTADQMLQTVLGMGG